jgi:hypothetical protein
MNEKLTALARAFSAVRLQLDEANDAIKNLENLVSERERDLLEAMVEEGVKSVSIDGVGLLSLKTTNYLSVNSANKEEFYKYLQESGNGSLLKLDVNPRTLSAFLKNHLEELIRTECAASGKDEIDARNECLEFLNKKGASYFTKHGISLRKGK